MIAIGRGIASSTAIYSLNIFLNILRVRNIKTSLMKAFDFSVQSLRRVADDLRDGIEETRKVRPDPLPIIYQ